QPLPQEWERGDDPHPPAPTPMDGSGLASSAALGADPRHPTRDPSTPPAGSAQDDGLSASPSPKRGRGAGVGAGPQASLASAFEAAYTERYGRMLTGLPIEATTWRIEARGPEGRVQLARGEPGDPNPDVALTGKRPVFFTTPEPGYRATPVYDRARLRPAA